MNNKISSLPFIILACFLITITIPFYSYGQEQEKFTQRIVLEKDQFKNQVEFTALAVEKPAHVMWSEIQLKVDNQLLRLKTDEHIILENRDRSVLITFNPKEHRIEFEGNLVGLELILINSGKAPQLMPVRENMAKKSNCDKPASISQETWRQGLPDPAPNPTATFARHMIIHHSAGNNEDTNYTQVVRDIYVYHTQTNGWDDIGYNYLIAPNGDIYEGRDGQQVTDDHNVKGAHFCAKNSGTFGICVLGNYMIKSPGDSILKSISDLLAWKMNLQNIEVDDEFPHPNQSSSLLESIAGHRDGCSTLCPGDSLYLKLDSIEQMVKKRLDSCTSPIASLQNKREHENLLYPNPVKAGNEVKLNLANKASIRVDIISENGKLVYSRKPVNQTFIANLRPGLYFVRIVNGESSFVKKLFVN